MYESGVSFDYSVMFHQDGFVIRSEESIMIIIIILVGMIIYKNRKKRVFNIERVDIYWFIGMIRLPILMNVLLIMDLIRFHMWKHYVDMNIVLF